MRLSLLLIPLGLGNAENYGPRDIETASLPNTVNSYTSKVVRNAQQNPNITSPVPFKPFPPSSNPDPNQSLEDVKWTWRVNISDLAAPHTQSKYATVDSHLVTTTYDFTWSGGGNFSTISGAHYGSGFCLTIWTPMDDMPVNVTNTFTTYDAGNTSCVPALGQACVDAIIDGRAPRGGDPFRCDAPVKSWSDIPECRDTMGYAKDVSQYSGTNTFGIGWFNDTNRNATMDWQEGQSFYESDTAPQNGSGSAAYYTAMNRLHIVLVDPILPSNASGFYSQTPQALCMRVNTTQLPTKDPNGDGITWTSEAVMESRESVGSAFQAGTVLILSTFSSVVSALFVTA
ncbi:hypothetical protein SUNI508_02608 [Seiridium unicorne]|uniref:Uncharacterized protein n=1 Tax=Seiridium unicorne TaxID=138068 RepID=A0ABR2UFX5_9PEZI